MRTELPPDPCACGAPWPEDADRCLRCGAILLRVPESDLDPDDPTDEAPRADLTPAGLRTLRERLELSAGQMALLLGVPEGAVRRWEAAGERPGCLPEGSLRRAQPWLDELAAFVHEDASFWKEDGFASETEAVLSERESLKRRRQGLRQALLESGAVAAWKLVFEGA